MKKIFNILIYITKFQIKFLASEIFSFPNERSHPFCASADRASGKDQTTEVIQNMKYEILWELKPEMRILFADYINGASIRVKWECLDNWESNHKSFQTGAKEFLFPRYC